MLIVAIVTALTNTPQLKHQQIIEALGVCQSAITQAMKDKRSHLYQAITDLIDGEVIEVTPPFGTGRGYRIWSIKGVHGSKREAAPPLTIFILMKSL